MDELIEARARADRAVAELKAFKEALFLLFGPAFQGSLPAIEMVTANIISRQEPRGGRS